MRAMKNPWKVLKKLERTETKPNTRMLSVGASTISIQLVIPKRGRRTMAAFTAFLKTKKAHYFWQSLSLMLMSVLLKQYMFFEVMRYLHDNKWFGSQ